jgi:drug/metabolite transporter (DMT)-like permease
LGERPRGAQWIAILLAFTGLLLIVAPWHWEGSLAPKLYAVLSGFGWAAATIATKAFQRKRRFDTINFVAWSMLLGLLPFFAIAVWRDVPAVPWTLSYALLVGYAGILAIAVAWMLWFMILHRLSASAASFSMLAIPVLTLGASIAVFGERIETGEWVGIGLVATALLVLGMLGLSGARRAVPRVAAGKG